MSKSAQEVAVHDRGGGEVWVTIDRPRKHNALARSVLRALAAVVSRHGTDADARCIVLRGAGESYFTAGGDLVEAAQLRTAEATAEWVDESAAALDAIRECPVPVIAYLNGDALGGGAELAVACDLRVMAPHARIGFIHGGLAITTAWGGGTALCRLVGPARALRMMARSELIAAEPALACGLADAVTAGGADGSEMRAFLAPLLERPPAILRALKRQARAAREGRELPAQRAIERENLLETWLSAEHWAAVDAFLARDRT